MKKIATRVFALLILCSMTLALASCFDKSGAVKAAFEDKGYTVEILSVNEDSDILAFFLDEEQRAKAAEFEFIYVSKSIHKGLIIKMPATGDVREFYATEMEDGSFDYSDYEAAVEAGWVNGNCVLFAMSADVKGIFKNA
jgi:hypothetical protein